MISISYFKHQDGRQFAMQKEGSFKDICVAIYKEIQKGHRFLKMESINPETDFKKDLTSLTIKAIKPKGRMH